MSEESAFLPTPISDANFRLRTLAQVSQFGFVSAATCLRRPSKHEICRCRNALAEGAGAVRPLGNELVGLDLLARVSFVACLFVKLAI